MDRLDRIIFWQTCPSPHQGAFLEAVADQFPGEVILGVESELRAERIAQGWQRPELKRVRIVDVSNPINHGALAAHRSSDSLHVFTGFFSHPLVWSGFHKLKSSQARLAIYSEAPEQPWHIGWLKRLRGRWLAARYAKRFAFVLAIGGIGCDFFERIGFPQEKIVPFGYYLAVPPLAAEPVRPQDGIFRFISAGQLIHRKGIDLLIKACTSLPADGWHLDIYGNGPQRPSLERLSVRNDLAERISFHGVVPNDVVQKALAKADCAVLPSRFDGWGALVSEALAVGTSVICTDRCGSAALVRAGDQREHEPCGRVTRTSIASLSAALAGALADGLPTVEHRRRCHAVAASGSPELAARRFMAAASLLVA